jgi:hypothetical protein
MMSGSMLVMKQFSGPAHAGLDLVDDQEQPALLGQRAQLLQELIGRRPYAGFALDRLQHDRNCLARYQPLDGIEIVELRLGKSADLGLEQRLESLLARRRHGRERAAVEAASEGDDLMRAAFVQRTEFARELDRALIGLGARVRKEHLVEAAVGDQRVGQFQAGLVEERGARRQQQLCLRRNRVGNDGRRMAEAIDGPALHEIEIALAAVVPQIGTFAPDEDGGRPCRDVHQRVIRMGGVGHVELLVGFWVRGQAETQEGRTLRVRPSRKRC